MESGIRNAGKVFISWLGQHAARANYSYDLFSCEPTQVREKVITNGWDYQEYEGLHSNNCKARDIRGAPIIAEGGSNAQGSGRAGFMGLTGISASFSFAAPRYPNEIDAEFEV